MDLEFPRGDTKVFKFKLTDKNGKDLILSSTDKIYVTAKSNSNSKEVLFQKVIGNGIELNNDGYYYVTINPNDTNDLSYGSYGYDIEVKMSNGIVKTVTIGTITITDEFTFVGDEV